MSQYIQSELEVGRLVGPIPEGLVPLVQVSPIGLIPKAHQVNKWRMIVDLSFPRHHSVNAGISEDLASLTYAHVDKAVARIRELGPGTELIKMDLESAYRQVPIHPEDHHLLGIFWNGNTCGSGSPIWAAICTQYFSAVADMMAWALHGAGIQHLIHYLDDFLFFVSPTSNDGSCIWDLALRIFAFLGIPVSVHKTEGPACCVTFLDILLDTVAGELRLPKSKVHHMRDLLRDWAGRRTCTRRQLECFLGHLSHAATVVRPGRIFLKELFRQLHQTREPHHFVRLSAGARADILWWKCLLHHWSGHSFFPSPVISHHVYSDASGGWGCGAFVEHMGWFQVPWPTNWQPIDISVKELVPVAIAAALWGPYWSGKHVCFHSDNMAVVAVLQQRSAKSPPLAHLLRCIALFSAYHSFHFSAMHVPGVHNEVADALSRNKAANVASFTSQAPQFHLPQHLHRFLISERPDPDWGSQAWTELFITSLTRVLPHPPGRCMNVASVASSSFAPNSS